MDAHCKHAVAVLLADRELVPVAVRQDGTTLQPRAHRHRSSPSEMLPRRAVLLRSCPATWPVTHGARACQLTRLRGIVLR